MTDRTALTPIALWGEDYSEEMWIRKQKEGWSVKRVKIAVDERTRLLDILPGMSQMQEV